MRETLYKKNNLLREMTNKLSEKLARASARVIFLLCLRSVCVNLYKPADNVGNLSKHYNNHVVTALTSNSTPYMQQNNHRALVNIIVLFQILQL